MKPRKPVRNPGWSYKRLDYSVEGESLFRVTVNFKNNPEWRDIDIVLARNKKEAEQIMIEYYADVDDVVTASAHPLVVYRRI